MMPASLFPQGRFLLAPWVWQTEVPTNIVPPQPIKHRSAPNPLLPVRPIRVLQINLSDFPPTFLPLLTEQGFEADATAAKNVVKD